MPISLLCSMALSWLGEIANGELLSHTPRGFHHICLHLFTAAEHMLGQPATAYPGDSPVMAIRPLAV
jgi:hypothetical protein